MSNLLHLGGGSSYALSDDGIYRRRGEDGSTVEVTILSDHHATPSHNFDPFQSGVKFGKRKARKHIRKR